MEVSVSRELSMDAGIVWTLLADWGNARWIPGMENCEIIDSPEGMMRRIDIPGGEALDEILLSLDPETRTLRYRIPRCPIFPFDDYVGTIVVNSKVGGACQVDWSCRFDSGGIPEAEAPAQARGNIKRLLDNLERYLEG